MKKLTMKMKDSKTTGKSTPVATQLASAIENYAEKVNAKKKSIYEGHPQHTPKKTYVKASSTVEVESTLYEAIREGLMAGFSNDYVAYSIGVTHALVQLCRLKLIARGLMQKNTYGINPWKKNSKGEYPTLEKDRHTTYWGIIKKNQPIDTSQFLFPKIASDSILSSHRPTERYYTQKRLETIKVDDMLNSIGTTKVVEEPIDMDGPVSVKSIFEMNPSVTLPTSTVGGIEALDSVETEIFEKEQKEKKKEEKKAKGSDFDIDKIDKKKQKLEETWDAYREWLQDLATVKETEELNTFSITVNKVKFTVTSRHPMSEIDIKVDTEI